MYGLIVWAGKKHTVRVSRVTELLPTQDGKWAWPGRDNYHFPGPGWFKMPRNDEAEVGCLAPCVDTAGADLVLLSETKVEAEAFWFGINVGAHSEEALGFRRRCGEVSRN